MNLLDTYERRDARRLRWLGEHAYLPAHVQTGVRRLVIAELTALGLVGDGRIASLRDRRHAADVKLQYEQHKVRQLSELAQERPAERRAELEDRIASLEAAVRAITSADQCPSTATRPQSSGLRWLLRKIGVRP